MSNTDPTKKCMYIRIKLTTLEPCKISISVTVTCDARNVYDNAIYDHGFLLANKISDIKYQKLFVNRKIIHFQVKKKSARHLKSVKKIIERCFLITSTLSSMLFLIGSLCKDFGY
jgi:hypothetical protein